LSCEQDAKLPGGRRVNQINTFMPCHRTVDQRESDLVHPAKIHPVRSLTILEDESTVASDRHQTRWVQLV
jgi:hypothetical protein